MGKQLTERRVVGCCESVVGGGVVSGGVVGSGVVGSAVVDTSEEDKENVVADVITGKTKCKL